MKIAPFLLGQVPVPSVNFSLPLLQTWQQIIFLTTFYSFSSRCCALELQHGSMRIVYSPANVNKWSYAKKVTLSTTTHSNWIAYTVSIQVCLLCVCVRAFVYVVLDLCFSLLYMFSFACGTRCGEYYYPFILIHSESQVL